MSLCVYMAARSCHQTRTAGPCVDVKPCCIYITQMRCPVLSQGAASIVVPSFGAAAPYTHFKACPFC